MRANASAGFSIVTYAGNNVNSTIGHGLGVAPQLIIAKSRTTSSGWIVYSSALGRSKYLQLHATDAAGTATDYWGTADPTSTVFGVYPSGGGSNNDGDMVAYCWTPVAGYSAFGSYVGVGGTAGPPFIWTGFLPKFVLIKRVDASGNWAINDGRRNTYNPTNAALYTNTDGIEDATRDIDLLSNGFAVPNTTPIYNSNGGTYIYAAFAEHPFAYARAR